MAAPLTAASTTDDREHVRCSKVDIQQLCRALRGRSSREAVPIPPALRPPVRADSPALLRRWLVQAADQAVRAGRITARTRDAWVLAEGLTGRDDSRARVAAALGVSASRLDQLRDAVAGAVAALIAHEPVPAPETGQVPAETALARLHAELHAADPPDPATEHAVQTLRRRTLTDLPEPARQPPASDAQRAARSRRRRHLEMRLAQQARAPVTVPARVLADGGEPDPERCAAVAEQARRLVDTDPAASRRLAVQAVRGYAALDTSPDPAAEARAWQLDVGHKLRARDMGAFWSAERVIDLLGPRHPDAVQAGTDAASVLRFHGYLRTAHDMLSRMLARVPGIRADEQERARLHSAILSAFGSTPPQAIAGLPCRYELEWIQECARENLRLLEYGPRVPSFDEWCAAQRRLLVLEHVRAVAAAREERARRPGWPERFRRQLSEYLAHAANGSAQTRVFTALSLARMRADRGDREGFAAAFTQFHQVWRTELPDYGLAHEDVGFRRRAARHGWADALPGTDPRTSGHAQQEGLATQRVGRTLSR